MKKWGSPTVFLLFFLVLLFGAFFYWTEHTVMTSSPLLETIFSGRGHKKSLNGSMEPSRASNYPAISKPNNLSSTACPEYFRWIHEDLRMWKSTGISRAMVERAKDYAHFRLVILKGKMYVEKYKKSFHTRDVFTIWGISQLLRLYPGKVPDLELMFWCEDRPVILKKDYQGTNATSSPSIFQYCGHEDALGIVFPDWTFWGEANKRTRWKDRVPYAYWRGNPNVAASRRQLMWCNVSDKYDWNARLYRQDWRAESEQGYEHSKLEDQCTHRYKIYIEGRGWSVSDKYLLACDSMTLFVKPEYYDFFIRSMVPLQHYWPVSARNKCRDIKFAVEWGNSHTDKAQAIGKAGSKFIQEDLKMERVYDYMFHLLTKYSELLKFKPRIPEGAAEVCSESMARPRRGLWKEFMAETQNFPSDTLPCTMPPPYESRTLEAFNERKENVIRQMEYLNDL
ncbi:KDEL motif-containing protein [Salix suchowensis]|nr:KDEL motif-containing protein [Salix suchowensis]